MLPTQVQYWTYKESQRHNIATEGIQKDTLQETIRHNKKTESQTDWFNAETKRHNLATENIGMYQANASMASAHAAQMSAAAAQQNANTNSYLSKYQSANIAASTTKTKSDTYRSWVDTVGNFFGRFV